MPDTGFRQRRAQGRRLRLRYVDVTGEGAAAAPHQEQVRAFEELGYSQSGLVRVEVESGGFEAIADDYAPAERAEMLERLPEPHTLLRSPDGSVVARIGWFWDWPGVELHSFMSDGARIETQRRWDDVPPWPAKRARQRRFATVEGEMTRSVARGRSIVVVADADARRLDEAHRAHVSAYCDVHGCTPARAPGTVELTRLSEHAHEHAQDVAHAYARVGNAVVLGLGFTSVLASQLLTGLLGAPGWARIFTAVLVTGVALAGLDRFVVRFAYTRWWRPAYRPGLS